MEIQSNSNLQIGNAYKVKWTDSCGTPAGWIDLETEDYPTEVQHITTYGTLINKSDDSIVLAQSFVEGGNTIKKQAMGIVVIVTACIKEISQI